MEPVTIAAIVTASLAVQGLFSLVRADRERRRKARKKAAEKKRLLEKATTVTVANPNPISPYRANPNVQLLSLSQRELLAYANAKLEQADALGRQTNAAVEEAKMALYIAESAPRHDNLINLAQSVTETIGSLISNTRTVRTFGAAMDVEVDGENNVVNVDSIRGLDITEHTKLQADVAAGKLKVSFTKK